MTSESVELYWKPDSHGRLRFRELTYLQHSNIIRKSAPIVLWYEGVVFTDLFSPIAVVPWNNRNSRHGAPRRKCMPKNFMTIVLFRFVHKMTIIVRTN